MHLLILDTLLHFVIVLIEKEKTSTIHIGPFFCVPYKNEIIHSHTR